MATATRPSTKIKKPHMTVGGLIRELRTFPPNALALISSDEEGNQFKTLQGVFGGTFGDDGYSDIDDDRFEGHDLKTGDPYVIIYPFA